MNLENVRRDKLSDFRLLLLLDMLLRERSVGAAAREMGLKSPVVSRMLGQLRSLYGDQLFIRTQKGLVPTPFAERLRPRLRRLATEAQRLFEESPNRGANEDDRAASGWEGVSKIEAVPLTVRPAILLNGQPAPEAFARKLSTIGVNDEPQRRLAKYIATAGSNAGGNRPLTPEESDDALSIILDGEADPIQVGVLLGTMQFRGATAGELAGFISAARRKIGAYAPGSDCADLDWPIYASPSRRTPPWHIHAARLVAQAGYRVMLHGYNGQGIESGKLEAVADLASIPICTSLGEAETALAQMSIAYLPIGATLSQLHSLLALYPLLEMRLPTNIVVHLLNPLGAPTTMLGVAKPSQLDLHRDVAAALKPHHIAIVGSTKDVAEVDPHRRTVLYSLLDGEKIETVFPAQDLPASEPMTGYTLRGYWQAVWTGAARDKAAEASIISTVAAALFSVKDPRKVTLDECFVQATELWRRRLTSDA